MFNQYIKRKMWNTFYHGLKITGYGEKLFYKLKNSINKSIIDFLYYFFDSDEKITFLDLGAYVGEIIEDVLKNFRNAVIHAFEPTPELINLLQDKYANKNNVHIYNKALSNFVGKTDFFISSFSPTNSLFNVDLELYEEFDLPVLENLKDSRKITVPVTTLNSWYQKNDVGVIDVLKIDTQGSELMVLQGASDILKDKVKLVLSELQFHKFYRDAPLFYKVSEYLYENSFFLFDFISFHKKDNIQLMESNAIFVNKNFFGKEAIYLKKK